MKKLLAQIAKCTVCETQLPLGPRPVVAAHPNAKIAIIGQAPGTKVHETGIPWDDPSGRQLRKWLAVTEKQFYDVNLFAIVPMGFCYPGKSKSGDAPPRPECAPLWHAPLFEHMPTIELTLLIGAYAQRYYLANATERNLTETVRSFQNYLPTYLPLPHPSPRNRFWLSKNHWFEQNVLPALQVNVAKLLN